MTSAHSAARSVGHAFEASEQPATADPAQRPGRLAVGVVSAGRVGAVLAAALRGAGHRVIGVSAVSAASRFRAAQLLPDVEVKTPDEIGPDADLLLLAVPDDVLPGLVEGFVNAGVIHPGQFVLHTSGRYGIEVLAAATSIGALPLALHPVMTFTGTGVDLARLAGVCFGVTSLPPLRPVAETLVLEMSGEPVWIDEANRPLYHAALAHGANHLVTLVASSMDLLRASGVDNPQRLLGPLLSAALDNALRFGDAGLTGPVVRGDAGTLQTHLDVLARVSPETTAAYVAMARLTADRALAAGLLAADDAATLLGVLSGVGRRPAP
jgi:predicted short-subunit dehydrogenase-like oxidoreductase (DUF2520 family)